MSGVLIDVQVKEERAQKALDDINKSLKGIKSTTDGAASSLKSMMATLATATASAVSLSYLKRVSDEFSTIRSKIGLVTRASNDLYRVQKDLVGLARANRTELLGTVSLFQTISIASRKTGASYQSTLKFVDAVQKSIKISGSSAEAAAGGLVQLNQALSSGVLRGEELNSIFENMPRVAYAIADSLGVSLGQLRKMGAEGKLTSESVFKGILSQSEAINAEFAKIAPTLSDMLGELSLNTKLFVTEMDSGVGASLAVAKAVGSISAGMEKIAANAFFNGAMFASGLSEVLSFAERFAKPAANSVIEVFSQMASALPKLIFPRTLFGDLLEGLRLVDDASRGTFTRIARFAQFGLRDLIDYDSSLEVAFKKLKRLSPTVWLTGRGDILAIKRVFSKEYMFQFADAVEGVFKGIRENTSSIFPFIGNQLRAMTYNLKGVARYFGLISTSPFRLLIGDTDNLTYSITELLRGVTGVQLKFTRVSTLLREMANPATTRLFIAIEDVLGAILGTVIDLSIYLGALAVQGVKSLFNAISDLLDDSYVGKIQRSVSGMKDSITTLLAMIPLVGRLFNSTTSRISSTTKDNLKASIEYIKKFALEVIAYFFEIYDAVIGHSWWTDTIEGVVDQSATLTSRVSRHLDKFSSYVLGIFEQIFKKQSFKLDFNIKTVDTSKLREKEFVLKNVKIQIDVVSTFKEITAQLKTAVIAFAAESKKLVYALAAIILGLVIAVFKPFGESFSLKLAAFLFEVFVAAILLASEKFAGTVFNISAAAEVGAELGKEIGRHIRDTVDDLPRLAGALVTFVTSFVSNLVRTVIGSIPLGIGSLLGGVYDVIKKIADMAGLGGPFGLIVTILFGRFLLPFAGSLGKIGGILTWIAGTMTAMHAAVGRFAGGIIGAALFGGPGGVAKIYATLAGIAVLTGGFDSLFAGSSVAKYLPLGLIAWILFGGNIAGLVSMYNKTTLMFTSLITKAVSFTSIIASSKIGIAALIGAFALFASSSANAMGTIQESTDITARGFSGIEEGIRNVYETLYSISSDDPLSAFLVLIGSGIILTGLAKVTRGVLMQIAVIRTFATSVAATITGLWAGFKATTIGGALVAALTGLGATLAAWGVIMKARMLVIGAAIFEALMVALYAVAPQLTIALISITDVIMRAITTRVAAGAMAMKSAIVGALISSKGITAIASISIAAVTGLSGGGITDVIMNVTTGLVLLNVAAKAVVATMSVFMGRFAALRMIIGILAAIKAALVSVFFLAFSAIALGVGILSIAFFGEGDSFLDKLDDVWWKLKRLTGFSNKPFDVSPVAFETAEKVTEPNRKVLQREFNLQPTNFNDVRFGKVNAKQIEQLQKLNAELNDAVEDARLEKYQFDNISTETRARIVKLAKSVEKFKEKLVAESTTGLDEEFKNFKMDIQPQVTGFGAKFNQGLRNVFKRTGYMAEVYLNKLDIFMASLPGAAPGNAANAEKKRAELARQNNTAKYRADVVDVDARSQSLIDAFDRIKDFGNIEQLDSKLAVRLANLKTNYTDLRKQLNTLITPGLLGGVSAPAKEIEQKFLEVTAAAIQLRKSLDEAFRIETIALKVRAFRKVVEDMTASLTESGVKIDEEILSTIGESDRGPIQAKIKALEALTKKIKDYTTHLGYVAPAERAAGIRDSKALGANVVLSSTQASERNLLAAPQSYVGNRLKGIGITDFNADKMSAGAASKQMAAYLDELELFKESLKQENFGSKHQFIPKLFVVDPERIKTDLAYATRILEQQITNVRGTLKRSLNFGDLLQFDISASGMDFGAGLAGMSERSIARLRGLMSDKADLPTQRSQLIADMNAKGTPTAGDEKAFNISMRKLADQERRIGMTEQRLRAKFMSLSDVFSDMNGKLTQLSFEDAFQLDDKTLDKLRSINREITSIKREMSLDDTGGTKNSQVKKMSKRLFDLNKQKTDLIDANSSFKTELEAFKKFGVNIDETNFEAVESLHLKAKNLVDRLRLIDEELSKPFASKEKRQAKRNEQVETQQERDVFNLSLKTQKAYAAELADAIGIEASVLEGFKGDLKAVTDGEFFAISNLKRAQATNPNVSLEETNTAIIGFQETIRKRVIEGLSREASLKEALKGAGIDESIANFVSDLDAEIIKGIATQLRAAKTAKANALTEAASAAAVARMETLDEALKTAIERAKYNDKMKAAGENFAGNVTSSLHESIRNFLKDEREFPEMGKLESLLHSIVDKVTNTIIDTVVEGFTERLMSSNGFMKNSMKELGGDLYDLIPSLLGVGSKSGKKDKTGEENSEEQKGIFGWFNGKLSNIFSSDNTAKKNLNSVNMASTAELLEKANVSTADTLAAADATTAGTLDASTFSLSTMLTNSWSLLSNVLRDSWSFLQTMFRSIFSGIGGGSQGKTSGLMGALGGGSDTGFFGTMSSASGFGQGLSDLWTGDTGFLGGNGLSWLLGMASGGPVSGAGTGVSDSILARLSNGEFVINAAATRANYALLEAINSGQKFAQGGVVGPAPSRAMTMERTGGINAGGQQIVNIKITGDISRQTRKEIISMLPQITTGVNMNNRENGHRN